MPKVLSPAMIEYYRDNGRVDWEPVGRPKSK